MTKNTQRSNIKLMLRLIAQAMMVFLGLFAAGTTKLRCWEQFTKSNSITNSRAGLVSFGKLNVIFNIATFLHTFPLCCLLVLTNSLYVACLAFIMVTIFANFVAIKLRNRLEFLALRASFCYSWFRHDFFLIKKLCLEPLQTQYLCGSLHCNTFLLKVNQKIKRTGGVLSR